MRKHFLILMLMALLPLASWATDVTVTLYDFTITYGNAQPTAATLEANYPTAVKVVGATYDDIKEYLTFTRVDDGSANWNSNEPGVYQWTLTKAVSTGTYTIYLSSNNAKMTIEKIPTTWTTDPVVKAAAGDYSGNPLNLLTTLGVSNFGTPEYSIDGGKNWAPGMPQATAVGEYTIKARVVGDEHNSGIAAYDLATTSTINGLDVKVTTAPAGIASLKYKGEAQDLITAGVVEGGTLMYKVGAGEWSTDIPQGTNQGNYTVSWKVVGDETHNNVVETVLPAINIAKVPLTVMTIAQTKPYDGTAFDPATAQYSISGRVGADATKAVTGLAPIAVFAAAADNYNVTVDASVAKIGEVALTENYTVNSTENVVWTIEKAALTVSAKNDLSMVHGAGSYPALDEVGVEYFTVEGAVDAAELATIKSKYAVSWANGGGEALDVATYPTADVVPVGEYKDALKLTQTADPVFDNYKVTEKKGTLTVTGEGFDIMPVVASDIEYGDAIAITSHATGGATYDEKTVSFTVKNSKGETVDITALPLPLGIYTITINEGVKGTGSNLGGKPNCLPGAFNIVKKHIDLTVNNQTVMKNNPAQAFLDGLAAAGEGVKGSYTIDALTPTVNGDVLVLEFSLDGITVDAKTGKITSNKGDYANAIKVALTDAPVNANYDITGYVDGQLTIDDSFTATLTNDGSAPAVIADAVANGSKFDVTVNGRALKAGQWNAMVLPFDVEPLAFCNALHQYAVFNTLSRVETGESALEDKIYFKLEMNVIPANTPFLIKPLNAVPVDQDILFEQVTFKGTGEDPVYTGVEGAKFTGTYKATADIESTNWWALQSGLFKHFAAEKANGLKFTNAFIELTSGASAAQFFVEEPGQNGVTAIKELNINTMESVDKEGWYTVSGVKLQGAPTQSGVYINNGKKVVIK